jgi:hypothetical protein
MAGMPVTLVMPACAPTRSGAFDTPLNPQQSVVQASLTAAGSNAAAIECFLATYEHPAAGVAPDAEKCIAARWLVSNMRGHGFVLFTLQDAKGNDIPFDIDHYPTLDAAQSALDTIEKEHGSVDFKMRRFDADLEHVSCAFLCENLEQAFTAWRNDPWMRDVRFEVFLESVLPYRASNEPLSPGWRAAARARIAPDLAQLGPNPTLALVTKSAIDAGHAWVPFSDRYYMHPTDQSYADMCRTKLGRCEDITTMITFAARASGAMVASDFTPWWANRDNNHAWEVAVDANGQGTAGLSNRAAKVYRKTFSAQADSLGARKSESDKVPGFLKSSTIRDVTAQYEPVTDIQLDEFPSAPAATGITLAPPEGMPAKFIYLAVFNGGEWRPMEWSQCLNGRAIFNDMGRGILYLPVWSNGTTVAPAGAPFTVDDGGGMHVIPDSVHASDGIFTMEAVTTIPATPDPDTQRIKPRIEVKPGVDYELLIWSAPSGWKSIGKRIAIADASAPIVFEGVPFGALCWLRAADGRGLERPFTMVEGHQSFW